MSILHYHSIWNSDSLQFSLNSLQFAHRQTTACSSILNSLQFTYGQTTAKSTATVTQDTDVQGGPFQKCLTRLYEWAVTLCTRML